MGASACCHGGSVYVVGGLAGEDPLCSIEKLSNATLRLSEISQWKLINVADTILTPRWYSIVCVLNDSEIAIMGGIGEINDEAFVLNDVVILNVDQN